jgi:hypothetical protein
MPWDAGARSATTSHAAMSARRRTCRTRVGRARRGAGATTGCCAAMAGTPSWHPWQVDRARWRQSTGRRTARGGPLAAGATQVAAMPWPLHACVCHWCDPTSSQPTFRRYKNQSSALPRVHAQPPPSSAARHLRRLGELIAPPASMAVWARLHLPLAHTELTRLRVRLTEQPARRSPSSRGCRRAGIAKLAPSPVPQAQRPT